MIYPSLSSNGDWLLAACFSSEEDGATLEQIPQAIS
jgi:hypothetical protein